MDCQAQILSLANFLKCVTILAKEVFCMRYNNMVSGIFLARPNRFIAHIEIDGREEICHVKNTGRCQELLVPGARVWCQHSDNPARKTEYDLIAVQKGERLINMDSQAPNIAAKEWLSSGGLGEISQLRAETVHGDSRFDFSFVLDGRKCFLEVKGVTLENDGICAFPDAPTERGVKHLNELTACMADGYEAAVCFVIQMEGMKQFSPNYATHPAFGDALRAASQAGVQVLAVECHVEPDKLEMTHHIPVIL